MRFVKFSFIICIGLAISFLFAAHPLAAVIMSSGQDEGYSGKVMDKVIAKWSPPKQLKKESSLRLSVSIDGEGEVMDCRVRKSSGLEALDASACAAVKAAAPYGSPPYGMPAEIFLAFWSGSPDSVVTPDPVLRSPDTSQADAATAKSVSANERARMLAEKAAAKTGKPLEPAAKNSANPAKVTVPVSAGKNGASPKAQPRVKHDAPNPAQATPDVVKDSKKAVQPIPEAKSESPSQKSEKAPQAATKTAGAKAPQKNSDTIPLYKSGQPVQTKYPEEYQNYLAQVVWQLRRNMIIPQDPAPGIYYLTAKLDVDKNGLIKNVSIISSSGNDVMDSYALRDIKRAKKILPPPAGLGESLDLTFKLVR